MVREDFLEGSFQGRSLFQAESTACENAQRRSCAWCVWRTLSIASGYQAPALSCFVLGPEDTVVPHSFGAYRLLRMREGRCLSPMDIVIAKCDTWDGGELGALHVWELGKV